MKLKHIPNILGVLRILMTIPIIFLTPFGIVSMVLYMGAGFTDMIDGPLARRIKDGRSQMGATLDSVADMLLVIVAIVFLMPAMDIWGWLFLFYIIALSFKIGSGFVGYVKHKEMVLLHTYTNKLLGFLLFITPILYFFFGPSLALNIYIIFVGVVIFVITTEEILINLMLKRPCRDIKSVFGIRAANRAFALEDANKPVEDESVVM
ncbi:MAG: CDP-alcohol phosphatidyltransferase family protein [Firmicutes bacterium]|nr:CDP-alcohol phosphatidyltransferase family protein [Bacillota bacterium]